MKKIITIAAFMLLAFSAMAQDGKSLYKKYSDAEGVSGVYISPAMFRLIGKIPDMEFDGNDVNLGRLIKSLSGFYLISSTNAGINAALYNDADRFIAKEQYEMLMESKDNGETVRMYTMGDEETVTGFVMVASEGDECTFICIDGQMKREELEKLLSESIN